MPRTRESHGLTPRVAPQVLKHYRAPLKCLFDYYAAEDQSDAGIMNMGQIASRCHPENSCMRRHD